ncbi:MAG TPA: DUF6249 domain-containing protein [Chthoniobacterales bacterium]|nr:DUF6249 domain-containing protein [Chthoniobacterales bacterium]
MKTLLSVSIGIAALATVVFAQPPATPQPGSPALSPSVAASPSVTASPASDLAEKIQRRIEEKFGGRHGVMIDTDELDRHDHEDVPGEVFPIVGISMLAVFGAPVLMIAVLGYVAISKNRRLHRTIQMMVEKGQPVPAELLAPGKLPARQRSDMRRGVILVMLGVGLMLWLAAVSDWEGGAWTLGLIPFLIGAGYLIVWKLEGGAKRRPDNPPPLP